MSSPSNSLVVTALNTYPLKSAGGFSSALMTLDSRGPQWDRRWMVVDHQNQFLTQRQLPAMCLITVTLTASAIVLSAPAKDDIEIVENGHNELRQVQVWDDQVMVQDCGEAVAAWLSDYLSVKCRLVFMPEQCQRPVDPDYPALSSSTAGLVSFADGFPILLTTEASLQDLNNRLTSQVTMGRFRPNIVVAGCDAFAEDGWTLLRIGTLEFSVVKPCTRCVIPSINPATGDKDAEVLRALTSYRRRDGAVYFGQNLIHHQSGNIQVGDCVEVLK